MEINKDIQSSATPWKYITLSDFMNSVKEDLHVYDDNNLISEDRVIKTILKCSEKLGERLHQSKQCKLIVKDYSAPIPDDLWKIENMLASICTTSHPQHFEGIFGVVQKMFTETCDTIIPDENERIIYLGCPKKDDCCREYNVTTSDRIDVQKHFTNHLRPLILSSSVDNLCTNYSPCRHWRGEYQADLQNDEFRFSFKEGEVYLSYLGNLVNEEGEILIPFHPMLNEYYELAVKEKILEDIFMNSEDISVQGKLQLVMQKKSGAYYDAYNFIQSPKANQIQKIRKKAQLEYYKKWFKQFD